MKKRKRPFSRRIDLNIIFKDGTTPKQIIDFLIEKQLTPILSLADLKILCVRAPRGRSTAAAIAELEQHPIVEAAEKPPMRELFS